VNTFRGENDFLKKQLENLQNFGETNF